MCHVTLELIHCLGFSVLLSCTFLDCDILVSFNLNYFLLLLFISLCVQADISGKVFADEAAGLYERATTTTLKNCMLLYFTYADFEEVRQFLSTKSHTEEAPIV